MRQLRSPNVTVTVVMVVVGTAVTKVVTVSDMMNPVTVVVTENMAVVVVVVASATNTTAVPVTVVVAEVVPATEMMVAVMVAEVVAVAEMIMAVVVAAVAEVAISQGLFFSPTAAPGRPQPALAERALHAQLVGRALLVAVLRTRIASTNTLAT